jgi:adenylate kinase family enzyme
MTIVKKIMIFGIPGSGKSTFASKLSKKLNIPVEHLDSYFFIENWVERDKQDFLQIQQKLVSQENWIIDGNAISSLEMRFAKADVALYFRFSRLLCLWRVLKRFLHKKQIGKAVGCSSKISWKFLCYLWNFNTRVEPILLELQKKYPHVQVYERRSLKEVEAWTSSLLKKR